MSQVRKLYIVAEFDEDGRCLSAEAVTVLPSPKPGPPMDEAWCPPTLKGKVGDIVTVRHGGTGETT